MTKLNRTLLVVASSMFLVLLTCLALFLGVFLGERQAERTIVSSQTIYDRITASALLTTKKVYLEQESSITIDAGSDWSNFWWGQTISGRGLVVVSVGIDLQNLTKEDIFVDTATKRILITLPEPVVTATELEGGIEVSSQQGVLKQLLANDPNKDYNLAMQQLKADAVETVNNREEIMEGAFSDVSELLKLLFSNTGYEVTINKKD